MENDIEFTAEEQEFVAAQAKDHGLSEEEYLLLLRDRWVSLWDIWNET